MTAWTRLLLPTGVTLSRSEGSIALGVEMLRCAQHDRAVLLPLHRHRLIRIGNHEGAPYINRTLASGFSVDVEV